MSDHAELNPTEVLHRLGLTEEMVRAHVMRPDHVMNATLGFDLRRPADGTDDPSNPPPPSGLFYRLDTDKLLRDLHGLLSFCLAGYSMQLRRYGRVVFDDQWNWSKTPVDGPLLKPCGLESGGSHTSEPTAHVGCAKCGKPGLNPRRLVRVTSTVIGVSI